MKFRLLLDLEVFEYIAKLSRPEQRFLHRRLRQIQDFPTGFVDYHEYSAGGHRIEISICGRFAISYSIDHLGGQIKILEIALADKTR